MLYSMNINISQRQICSLSIHVSQVTPTNYIFMNWSMSMTLLSVLILKACLKSLITYFKTSWSEVSVVIQWGEALVFQRQCSLLSTVEIPEVLWFLFFFPSRIYFQRLESAYLPFPFSLYITEEGMLRMIWSSCPPHKSQVWCTVHGTKWTLFKFFSHSISEGACHIYIKSFL